MRWCASLWHTYFAQAFDTGATEVGVFTLDAQNQNKFALTYYGQRDLPKFKY